jgi:hypothetical protein
MQNLQSSLNEIGEIVTQIFHFRDGTKKTFDKLILKSVKEGKFTKIKRTNGSVLSVNPDNVNCFETFSDENQNQILPEIILPENYGKTNT